MTKVSRKLLVCSVLLALTFVSIGAIATPDWMNRSGTIAHAIAQPDGTKVYFDAVIVDKIKGKQTPSYFVVHESWGFASRIVVKVEPPQVLRPWQTVDIEGTLGTLPNGERALFNPSVIGYFDKNGQLLYHGPLTKGIGSPTPWQWKAELTGSDSAATSIVSTTPPDPNEPTSTPATPPLYCDSINIAKQQSVGTVVELQCRPISSTGSGLFLMGEDGNSDSIKVYYTKTVSQTDRINKITGTIHTEGSDKVLDVDSGPGYDPQVYTGTVQNVVSGSIAWAKTFPNGTLLPLDGRQFALGGKILAWSDGSNAYIVEPDRSCGILMSYTELSPDAASYSVKFNGYIDVNTDGERFVYGGAEYVKTSTVVKPLSMNQRGLGGSDFNVYTPGTGSGMHTMGLIVKLWGKVTAVNAGDSCFYIDDGVGLLDGTVDPVTQLANREYVLSTTVPSNPTSVISQLQLELLVSLIPIAEAC